MHEISQLRELISACMEVMFELSCSAMAMEVFRWFTTWRSSVPRLLTKLGNLLSLVFLKAAAHLVGLAERGRTSIRKYVGFSVGL